MSWSHTSNALNVGAKRRAITSKATNLEAQRKEEGRVNQQRSQNGFTFRSNFLEDFSWTLYGLFFHVLDVYLWPLPYPSSVLAISEFSTLYPK